jgi:hypothetical protein
MTLEEAGRTLDQELKKLGEKLDTTWKTTGRPELIAQLRKASHTLADLAERLEKSAEGEPRA